MITGRNGIQIGKAKSMVSSLYRYISWAPSIIRQLKKSATEPKIKELMASNILIFRLLNFTVMKSTITLPFFKWHKGKNDPIETAHAISTNSKSPNIGLEKTTRPKIDNKQISEEVYKKNTPKIAKKRAIWFKIRPNSLSGRISVAKKLALKFNFLKIIILFKKVIT